MEDADLEILRACRRSRVKVRVYRVLAASKVVLLAELAEAASTTIARVRAVMFGEDETYRPDSSLTRLGVARQRRTRHGPAFEITPLGEAAWRRVRPRLRG